ncbi:sensor histidine kinase [Carboxylicivirga linearis]|uniref:Histidine kinase n=1 Tax=Carboxylicivirga linearis TaxID=1628157 RepID=A0ABS5JPZ4_9BACT|nr:histidine kinase [Carboxylicivirga linearis]MBS2096948.1 histidine kinase [Carboxylicivirga linearis]
MQIVKTNTGWIAQIVNNRVVQHISYWVLFIVFFAFAWGTYDNNFAKTILIEIINLPAKILLVYTILYFLFPRYLYKGKIWKFIISFLIILFIASFIQRITDYYIIVENFFPMWDNVSILSISQLVRAAVNFGAVLAIPMTVKFMDYLAKVKQHEQALINDKLEAELIFLKNQVHPHFLFNTLNSLYSLILKKSDQSLEVVLKLSGLLRYMLYETNAPEVSLDKELESIKNYLELEQIRYGKRVELSFNVWGDFSSHRIAPMLLLPFIENSFKHSTKGFSGIAMIAIEIGCKGHELILKVENSKPSGNEKSELASGIGLHNVKRRLDILYPNQHQLKIEDENESFLVILKMNLKN